MISLIINLITLIKCQHQQKVEIWDKIISNKVIYKKNYHKDIRDLFNLQNQTCDLQQDIYETKNNQQIAVQALIQYIPLPNQKYTGIFEGSKNAILRISSLNFPTGDQAKYNFIPKLQIKFFRNNNESADISALYSYQGIDTWNLFKYDLSTSFDDQLNIDFTIYNQVRSFCNPFIYNFGIKQLATHNENGEQPQLVKYPYKIIFKPNSQVVNLFGDEFSELFTQQLKKIPKDTNIYDVYAINQPQNACQIKIGTIKLKSKFVSSSFADQYLHFSDLSVKQDLLANPNWEQYMTEWSYFGVFNKKKLQEGKCDQIANEL